ncbi:MAG: ABC transporter permease, partial [Erysipelotrichaceae bacterium]|nr:ABC transporter permease [Erysipelotrichaceae bacterium]
VSASQQTDSKLKDKISKVKGVKSVLQEEILSVSIEFNKKDVAAYLNILENPSQLEPYMTFIPVMGSDPDMKLSDDGVFISIKTAEKMGLQPGSDFTFETAGGQTIHTKVTGIFDQYINHQIYVTKKLYDSWNIKEKPNTTFLLLNETSDSEAESEMGAEIMNMDQVKSISFYSKLQENFLNMIQAIKLVVVVLVFSAAMLAFVVLYNLSNVNISERLREIATIKVLGFTEKEVNQYINRESLLLALIGGVLGLGVGIWLHSTIMALAELDDIRFGRTILPLSFLLSLALTMAFALAINWIMKFKLRKIKMVESLKSIE